jgi:heptosyltransferase I
MPDPRFLVVRLGSLGDIVHTFPAVAALRQSSPSSEIVWLTHPRWVELVAASGLASVIWPVDSRDLSSVRGVIDKIRSQCWIAAIDYQGLWKAAFLPFFGGVPKRIGFSSATIREFGVPILYTERVDCKATHIADQNGELSLRAGAHSAVARFELHVCARNDAQVRFDLGKAGLDHYIVLSPGGGWRSKCWPAERFGALCQKIRDELGLACVINYGPGEESLAEEVRIASGNSNPVVYDGELGTLMALVRGAECIIGGDTGPLHLAVALGTRCVALFGPTDPARNGPYPSTGAALLRPMSETTSVLGNSEGMVLRSTTASTTYGRADTTDPSLLALSVEEVFEAVKQVVGASS